MTHAGAVPPFPKAEIPPLAPVSELLATYNVFLRGKPRPRTPVWQARGSYLPEGMHVFRGVFPDFL